MDFLSLSSLFGEYRTDDQRNRNNEGNFVKAEKLRNTASFPSN